jgi:hypothetical protein
LCSAALFDGPHLSRRTPVRLYLNAPSTSVLFLSSSVAPPSVGVLHSPSFFGSPFVFHLQVLSSFFLHSVIMGNNPSKQPSGGSSSNASTHTKESKGRDGRRQSIQPFSSGGKANAADPSESITSATAQSISQPAGRGLETLRPSNSPDLNARNIERLEGHSRTPSRNSRKDVEIRPKGGFSSPGPSGPVKVPTSDRSGRQHDRGQTEPTEPLSSAYYGATSRPPRLPLPIEHETYQPGSPIITPADINNASLDLQDLEDELPRKSSMLSNTTVDDDEVGEELQPTTVDGINKTVPTLVEWRGSGDKVYVTGTFANWNKKFRLHRK